MTLGLRVIAQALLMLTSIGVYGTHGALHSRGGVLTSIVLVALLTFAAILAHELAHAATARMVGARVHAIVAFPFRLRLQPRRLELIKRGARQGDLGGYVSYTLDRIDTRRKRAIIAAAGPIANLALALQAGAMVPAFDSPPPPLVVHAVPGGAVLDDAAVRDLMARIDESRQPSAPIILFAFALLSGGLGLANLIPYRGSDGDQIANLWRRRGARR
jgi:hypothetical protein